MFCPRCGAKNEEGNRYCVGCGADLPGSKGKSPSTEGTISSQSLVNRVIGASPRARLLSAGTALAVVIAIIAFIALAPSDDAVEDAYTRQLDRSCVVEKQTITALQRQTARQAAGAATFAGALVTIVEEWRSNLQEPPPPPAHVQAVEALDSALLDVVIEAGGLARVARDGSSQQVAVAARNVDTASAGVERAIENLGLSRCADLAVATAGVDSQ